MDHGVTRGYGDLNTQFYLGPNWGDENRQQSGSGNSAKNCSAFNPILRLISADRRLKPIRIVFFTRVQFQALTPILRLISAGGNLKPNRTVFAQKPNADLLLRQVQPRNKRWGKKG